MEYGTNDPEALARLKELRNMTAEAKAAMCMPAPEQINEYWVVEFYSGNLWCRDGVYEELEPAIWDNESQVNPKFRYRIVHYTGHGASVVAEWNEKGERVK